MTVSNENIALQLASIQGGIVTTLIDTLRGGESGTASFADIFAGQMEGLTADGRNPALRDPESAYTMMTKINAFEVDFKAGFAELDALGAGVEELEAVAAGLGDIAAGDDIAARLQAFVDQYNAWEDRFDDTVADGGVLDNVQAAEIAFWELEQSIKSIFNGAAAGVGGLADLGISIDPATKQAVFDPARLQATLAGNPEGAASAIREFGANFAKSADLLNADGNFITNQLDNYARAIGFIAENGSSLREEFGTGDAARPSGDVAKALAAYEAMFAV
jgi:hypothetical protein